MTKLVRIKYSSRAMTDYHLCARIDIEIARKIR